MITLVFVLTTAFESPVSVRCALLWPTNEGRHAPTRSSLLHLQQFSKSLTKVAIPAAAAAVLAVGPNPAHAGDAGAGSIVFSGNCNACHSGGRNVIVPQRTLQQDALEEYLDGGANEEAVIKQVTNGKNAMPAFGGRLSDEDIKNVAAYVISTAKAGWD